MIYSLTQLAQRRGCVVINRVTGTPFYEVQHRDVHNEIVEMTGLAVVEGETARDTKSRAIAAVRMLGYWPELRRSIAEERGVAYGNIPVLTSPLAPAGAVETHSGLILQEDARHYGGGRS